MVQYLFLHSRLACCILNLAIKHDKTFIPAYIHIYPFQCGSGLTVMGEKCSRMISFSHSLAAFQLWGQLGLDLLASFCTNQFKHCYIGDIVTSGSLRVKCLQLSLAVSDDPSCVSFNSSVQVSGGTCQRSIKTS